MCSIGQRSAHAWSASPRKLLTAWAGGRSSISDSTMNPVSPNNRIHSPYGSWKLVASPGSSSTWRPQ
jgi:hypothetical protein